MPIILHKNGWTFDLELNVLVSCNGYPRRLKREKVPSRQLILTSVK